MRSAYLARLREDLLGALANGARTTVELADLVPWQHHSDVYRTLMNLHVAGQVTRTYGINNASILWWLA